MKQWHRLLSSQWPWALMGSDSPLAFGCALLAQVAPLGHQVIPYVGPCFGPRASSSPVAVFQLLPVVGTMWILDVQTPPPTAALLPVQCLPLWE